MLSSTPCSLSNSLGMEHMHECFVQQTISLLMNMLCTANDQPLAECVANTAFKHANTSVQPTLDTPKAGGVCMLQWNPDKCTPQILLIPHSQGEPNIGQLYPPGRFPPLYISVPANIIHI